MDLWFRTTSGSDEVLAARHANYCGVGGGGCQWDLFLRAPGQAEFCIGTGGGSAQHCAYSISSLSDGSWHHAAMTVNNTTKVLTLYVDGVLQGTDATWSSGSPGTGAWPISIGRAANGENRLNGRVDELRFQAGVRTAEELRSYYVGRVADYADPANDWDSTASTTRMFGACLREVVDGAATDGTTWTANASCPATDGDWWRPVVATEGAAGSKVAITPGPDVDAKARLRFGLRIPTNQPPGVYTAPVVFEVVAPDA